jgi:hypothetical protein
LQSGTCPVFWGLYIIKATTEYSMKNWLTRITMPITVTAAVTFAGVAGPAVAAPVTPNFPGTFSLLSVFGSACPGFDVMAQLTGKSKEMVSNDGNRKIQISPGTTITLSANGKSLTYLITGVTHIQVQPDGSEEVRSTGKNLLVVPNVENQHVEGLFFTTGNVNYARIPGVFGGGEIRLFSGPGQVVNVCELLKS